MTNTEKTEVMEAVEMKENEQEQSRKERVLGYFKRNKKQCGVVAGALVLVIAGGGLAIASGNINPVDTLTGVNNNSTTSSAHSTTKANDAKNTSAMDADAQATEGDKSAEATSTDGSSNVDTTNSDTNANGSTQSASGATSGSNGNSGTTTASSSNSQQQASTPAHTHSWTTIEHPAVTRTEDVYEFMSVCTDCGTPNFDRAHLENHLLNGGSGGTHGETVKTGTRTIVVTPAWTETKCSSCGATK